MQTKHTAGPWATSNNVRQRDDAQRIYAGDIPVASVHHLSQKTTEAFYQAHANARLIAGAPELLAQLQKLVRAIDRLPGNNPLDGLADDARAAINRAIGA